MEQVITRLLQRHGYTLDAPTFQELGHGKWVTWAKDDASEEDWLVIGSDEQFVVLGDGQALSSWISKHAP